MLRIDRDDLNIRLNILNDWFKSFQSIIIAPFKYFLVSLLVSSVFIELISLASLTQIHNFIQEEYCNEFDIIFPSRWFEISM